MAYGTFKSVGEVAEKFDVKINKRVLFIHKKPLKVSKNKFDDMEEELQNDTNYINEYAICDGIIRPILKMVAKNYPLEVWSHPTYNVDEEKGLIGRPDYLIAPLTQYGEMARPSLCVIEAKKADFDEGWTQALAEMVASSLLGAKICYGIVSTGDFWQFGKLENNVFIKNRNSISATRELQYVFDTLNWMFNEISE